MMRKYHPLRELLLGRLREFMREPETIRLSADFVGVHEIRHTYYSIPGGQREAAARVPVNAHHEIRARQLAAVLHRPAPGFDLRHLGE